MPFKWRIDTVRFSGGDQISLEPKSVLILIGPNRAGKSTALRNIAELLIGEAHPLVCTEVAISRDGSGAEFAEWLTQHYPVGTSGLVSTKGGHEYINNLVNVWNQRGGKAVNAHPFILSRLDTETRLSVTNYVRSIPVYEQPPQAYVHLLQIDPRLEKEISDEIHNAFGVDIMIDWLGGDVVGFHVGPKPTTTDRVSPQYAKEMKALPRLEQEGDGIRSFVGALLATKCGAHPVLLIDEPEAFLHPPQANRLGRIIAQSAAKVERQVIVATHSAEVVQGALAARANVSVCRLTREGSQNYAALLDPVKLADLWSKPLLRSAATISGLFHEGTIVCEAYGDAQFYEAVVRRLMDDGRFARTPDLYFANGVGKGNLAALAGAYASLKTRCAVIADLDLLRNKVEFEAVLNSMGHSFNEFEALYRLVVAALAGLPPEIQVDAFYGTLVEIADRTRRAGKVNDSDRRELEGLLAKSSDWSAAKRVGIDKLRGAPRVGADELLKKLKEIGIFLVPEGELEGWWRQGPATKSEWVPAAVEAIVGDPAPFQGALQFILEICRYLSVEC